MSFIRNGGLWAPILAVLYVTAIVLAEQLQLFPPAWGSGPVVSAILALIAGGLYAWLFSPDARRVRELKKRRGQ
ncbi:hypothetical protein ACFONC_03360 [Luteimonas soli]|uniref:DUF4175 domain-containing protein n=1 Tax=Luteimonas soli TaxID=1648966 RepID=A0ABV7XHE4_9GAMM